MTLASPTHAPPGALTTRDLPSSRAHNRFSFGLHLVILIALLAASSAPTPLYSIYQSTMALSSVTVTVIFAAYTVSLLVALLIVGSLSDHLGRKPVVLAALALEVIAMAGFLIASDATGLIVARALQGVATGTATAAIGAGLADALPRRAPTANSVAPIVGMAVGALGAAIVAGTAAQPTVDVFVVLLATFVVLFIVALFLQDSNGRRPGALASLRISIGVPAAARRAFMLAAPVLIAVWAIGGFVLSLGPTLARTLTGSTSPMVGGWFVFALTAAGALAVLTLSRVRAARAFTLGAAALVLGVSVMLLGVAVGAPAALFAGAIITGIGFGAGFQGAMHTIMPLAEPHERAGLLATVYVVSYLSMSIPAIGAGVLSATVGIAFSAYAIGGLILVLALAALLGSLAQDRRNR